MAKQNINIGSTANDGSGDSLRDAAVKINSNFTELYNISGLDTSFTQGAFNAANSSTVLAQSGFNAANSSTVLAQSAFDQANNGVYTSNTLINGSHTVKLNDGGLLEIDQGYGFIGPFFGPGTAMFSDATGDINNVESYYSVIGSFSANTSGPESFGYMGTYTGMGNNVSAFIGTYNDTTQSNPTWEFGDGNLTLPQGSTIGETTNTTVITPPGALIGQSLVIRPTAPIGITSNHPSGFIDGDNIVITVTPNNGSTVTGTVDYTFTGCTEEQLGRALTGILTYGGESLKTITWTIPVSSSITTFTITLSNSSGFGIEGLSALTLTRTGSTEDNHIHLVSGNPTTVDLYLGDDDQYVKIEKNGGNVVIGTNSNSKQWTFGTDGNLRLPEDGYIVGNLRLPEDGYIVDSHGISVIVHPYVLDIEIDGGTTNSVYSKNDIVFDGGSTSSVFTFGQAVIDGCSAFSHSISKNFDGGSAVTI